MMRSFIAGTKGKRGRCWKPSEDGWPTAVWNCIRRRPKSSTARTRTGGKSTSELSSIFSAIPSNLGGPRIGGALLRQLPAGDQYPGGEGGAQDHPPMADGIHQEQSNPGGPGPPDQSGGARLAELLRALLPLEVRSGAASCERGPRPLGATEIQTVRGREVKQKSAGSVRPCIGWDVFARRDHKGLLVLWQLGTFNPEAGG